MATIDQVRQSVALLLAAYPNAKLVPSSKDMPGTIDVYLETLIDLEPQALMQAVKYCIQTIPNFLPSVSSIRESAARIQGIKDGTEISGQEAWGIVIRAIDIYHPPHFEDERIQQAVQCIGWRDICLSDEQDPAIRAQFIKAFEAIAKRHKDTATVAQLESHAGRVFQLTGDVAKKLTRSK